MYPEKENYRRVLARDDPSHVCCPPPSKGEAYRGAWPHHSRPSPDARQWRDEWGVLWQMREGEAFPTEGAVNSWDRIEEVEPPDPSDPARMQPMDELVGSLDRERYFLSASHPYFLYEKAINILTPAEFCAAMVGAPDRAHQLLDMILEFELGVARQYVRYRPDSVGLSDDYGHQDRLAMSPACWREFFKPRIKRVVDFYRGRLGPDIGVSLHSCGHVMPILEDLMEIGVDILHPVQSTANDLAEARRRTSGRLTLAGCICGQRVLPFGTAEEVRREVFAKLDLLWENGGYLPMPEKRLGVAPENLLAMESAVRDWSRANVER
jgi:uroporphyrinogen decarboxylase